MYAACAEEKQGLYGTWYTKAHVGRKWKIRFGEPIHWGNYGPEAADDEILVGRLSERVRATIQGMLDQMVSRRRSIWLG